MTVQGINGGQMSPVQAFKVIDNLAGTPMYRNIATAIPAKYAYDAKMSGSMDNPYANMSDKATEYAKSDLVKFADESKFDLIDENGLMTTDYDEVLKAAQENPEMFEITDEKIYPEYDDAEKYGDSFQQVKYDVDGDGKFDVIAQYLHNEEYDEDFVRFSSYQQGYPFAQVTYGDNGVEAVKYTSGEVTSYSEEIFLDSSFDFTQTIEMNKVAIEELEDGSKNISYENPLTGESYGGYTQK